MARKADIKQCRYNCCLHTSKEIDISQDEYEVVKTDRGQNQFFHKDCLAHREAKEQKEKKVKADIQLIKNIWIENISQTVAIPHLYKEINRLVFEQGISTEFIIFALQYCIKNHFKLRYPGGLKYYLDKQEIIDAYNKTKAKKVIAHAEFTAKETEDNTPKFSVNRKPSGFGSILGRKY